jgi:phenylalanyl-tRNA synthetase beta chain
MRRAALLVQELAGGEISSDVQDVYPEPIKPWKVEVKYANVDRLIGKQIPHDRIHDILINLGMEILEDNDETIIVEVPTFKADVTREADIIEEILRIYGYNNIDMPEQVRASLSYIEKPDREEVQELISNYLSNNGFAEIMNNSLTKASYSEKFGFINKEMDVKIHNPLSGDLGVMRQTLLTSGLESIIYNVNRKNADLRFYEFGKTYMQLSGDSGKELSDRFKESMHLSVFVTGNINLESWHDEQNQGDVFYLKSQIYSILNKLKIDERMFRSEAISDELFSTGMKLTWNGKEVIVYGQLKGSLLGSFDIQQPVFWADFNWDMVMEILKGHKLSYRPVSKFPEVRRDLALLVDSKVEFAELKKLAFDAEKKLLKSVNLFDVYEGENIEKGKKSYALSFVLQDDSKTLTDKIIDKTMKKLAHTYQYKVGATLR